MSFEEMTVANQFPFESKPGHLNPKRTKQSNAKFEIVGCLGNGVISDPENAY